ncbi:hypothetical protein F4813DRAFT_368171 [Daldinia decipiens]|uniref:uncharacterized protein n=1 Tax=Daldinia decipiens TaxID=326647 RepID=UPI0020C3FCE0|nr:uncharacterized protein F4813DRAFT_368171 [Daldinia decipiens]KAI1655236.1 hypothetical protein F4813DRAFT_368171 [Daldinia decipiens]
MIGHSGNTTSFLMIEFKFQLQRYSGLSLCIRYGFSPFTKTYLALQFEKLHYSSRQINSFDYALPEQKLNLVPMVVDTKGMAHRTNDTVDFDIYTPIHSKYVPNPEELSEILEDQFGAGEYVVEMRHNTYNVKSKARLDHGTIERIRQLSNITKKSTSGLALSV